MVTFKPTSSMKSAAKSSLLERTMYPSSHMPMTDIGVARARQILSGRLIPLRDVIAINAFHQRHAKNYSTFIDSKGRHTRGRIAIDGWGGLAGKAWANNIVTKFRKK
jgi:hypothetical protein